MPRFRKLRSRTSEIHKGVCQTSDIQKFDRDRFRTSLFLPEELRGDVWAVLAWNVEISRTPDMVKDPQIGLIRLQWWRERLTDIMDDTITGIHNPNITASQNNPVLAGLSGAISRYNLSGEDFEILLKTREHEFRAGSFEDLAGLAEYAQNTAAPIFRLIARMEDPFQKNNSDVVANQLGRAYGLTGILRALPVYLKQGRDFLPVDLQCRHNFEHKNIQKYVEQAFPSLPWVSKSPGGPLYAIIHEIYVEANRAFDAAMQGSSRSEQGIFHDISLRTTASYLQKLRRLHLNIFHPGLATPGFLLPFHLWWRYK